MSKDFKWLQEKKQGIITKQGGRNQHNGGNNNQHQEGRASSNKYEILKIEDPMEGEENPSQVPKTQTEDRNQSPKLPVIEIEEQRKENLITLQVRMEGILTI